MGAALAATPALPCSAFIATSSDRAVLAKNFDWHLEGGYLIKSPRGVMRRGLPLFGSETPSWTSRYGSLTLSQYGVGLPYGGMNEQGLAVEMLWLDETVYGGRATRSIGELEWIQLQLDSRSTVAEVLEHLDELAIHPMGGKIHYVLADASGDKALVEFVDGVARVFRGEDGRLVTTNDTRRVSELAFEGLRTGDLRGNTSRVRYARLRRDLEALKEPPGAGESFALLDRVAERGSPYRTQWSVVYDLRAREMHIRPDLAGPVFRVEAGSLDYAEGSGFSFQDLRSKGLATAAFAPLTLNAQRPLLARNLPRAGIDQDLDAINAHLLDAGKSKVNALSDRSTLVVEVTTSSPGAFARIAVFRNEREIRAQTAQFAGSVLMDATARKFAFYNLSKGRYAVGAYHDLNQNGRHEPAEPLAFFRPKAGGGAAFADLSFDLTESSRLVSIRLAPDAPASR